MEKKHIYFFIGTTAEFIKLAPIIKLLKRRKINFKLIVSGQNPINFECLKEYTGNVTPDIALSKKSSKSSIALFAYWTLKCLLCGIFSLRKEFYGLNRENSYFIIHGDTVSSLLGSLISKFYGLKLVHIESGLRSYDFFEPFPEEICRYINTRFADILFCPNAWALNNIKKISGEKVNTKQNTLIETFQWAKNKFKKNYKGKFNKYFILYIKRQEHIYFQKQWTQKIITKVIKNAPKNLKCLFAVNTLNTNFLRSVNTQVTSLPLLPYKDFMQVLYEADFIATDGCTNQEEAYYMGLPLIALRNKTERIEGIGQNVIISKGNEKIIRSFLKNYKKYRRPPIKLKESPSKIIVDYLSIT